MLGLGEPGCIWYHDQNESPSFFVLGGGGGGGGAFSYTNYTYWLILRDENSLSN